ncbi:MAG: purine-nucleoside phosphorylase [Bacteroidales bacterium]|jgi:purine-nucleoside phosphorylase|nr:purine-nucleoside phosphorylase [Bacteroidales bacterium]
MDLLKQIEESAHFLAAQKTGNAKTAIILGSGLGGLVDQLIVNREINYKDIPHFPVSTVKGHKGSWIFGMLNGVDVVVLNGRFHYYEGYAMNELTFPIRVLKAIGIEHLILSNAAGGMNPTFKIGDVMLIRDHINLFSNNPLLGPNDDRLGVRFLDMSEAYSPKLLKLAKLVAEKEQIQLQQGVYVGVSGPCFETPAEYRMYHILGGDAIGMSTVPETIVARHSGMEVFALSVITDLGVAGQVEKVSHEEVLQAAQKAGPKMVKLIYEMLPQL